MIWLTWKQSRVEAWIGLAILAALGALLIFSGIPMRHAFDSAGLSGCTAVSNGDSSCGSALQSFFSKYDSYQNFFEWQNFLPFVLALLLSAPTLFDLESGLYRLAWTQGISRVRWTAVRTTLLLGTAAIVSYGLVLLWTWWRHPFDSLNGRISPQAYNFEGIVPIAYVVFAVALMLCLGAIVRRAIVSAVAGFVLFLVARLGIENWVRPRLFEAPVTWINSSNPVAAGSWEMSQSAVLQTNGSSTSNIQSVFQTCAPSAPSVAGGAKTAVQTTVSDCLRSHGVVDKVVFQPASRFWRFQLMETGIFLALAAVCVVAMIVVVQCRDA